MFACPERPHQFLVELAQHVVGHGLEAPATGAQGHPEGAPVVRRRAARTTNPSCSQSLTSPVIACLDSRDTAGELAEAQAVPLEQRHQHRPVGGPDIGKPTIGEPLDEQLVEAL